MICDNDDFIIQSGINKLLNFLEKNDQYISATGEILNFEINNFKFLTKSNVYFYQNINILEI